MGYSKTNDFSEILERRMSRRGFVKTAAMSSAALATTSALGSASHAMEMLQSASSLTFTEVKSGLDEHLHVAKGYDAQILMRWGDKVLPDAPEFDPYNQTAEAQAKQFGFNNDFIGYFPLQKASRCDHGLLCVNHEYTSASLMFPGYTDQDEVPQRETAEQQRIEIEAHGVSIVEIAKKERSWEPIYENYNRRITGSTPITIQGPAAGHERMKTSADETGRNVLGILGNCAGGMTPWGTYLTCEENIDVYFDMNGYEGAESDNHRNMTIGKDLYHRWHKIDKRFDVKQEPHEPNRFGWVVEIDPKDPKSTPIKRTALGRFKHEGASPVVNRDGRVVVYMGDDEEFQYIYRFITRDHYDPKSLNPHLLDDGVLSVARFEEDGSMTWLPLIFGEGPLTKKNGFNSQADVVIEARKAATMLGATQMDRPEDVEVNPATQRIYASMTKNPARTTKDAVNRRANNPMGYVLEMIPPKADHTAERFEWEIFLEGGDPKAEGVRKGFYHNEPTEHGIVACPDNLAFDGKGRIWITTDGQPGALGKADAVYAADTQGPKRGQTRCFLRGPVGCEVTGPQFSPDGRNFFLSIQHPGEYSSFEKPSTRWPDFHEKMPPRPSVLAITKEDDGLIG